MVEYCPLAFASSKCNNAITNNAVYAACRNKLLSSILKTMAEQELKLYIPVSLQISESYYTLLLGYIFAANTEVQYEQ